MKSYGHSRRDKRQCKFGCCQLKRGTNEAKHSDISNRNRRKTARQTARQGIFTELLDI